MPPYVGGTGVLEHTKKQLCKICRFNKITVLRLFLIDVRESLATLECGHMLATQKIKYIIAVILAVVVGVVFAISTKSIRTFGAALIVAAYFGMQLFETIQNEKKGKYRKITALAVSADESRSGLGTVETWRFIPVDENGEYIDTNGRLDIFLQIKPKERNYHIGGTYNLLFCADEDDTLTQDNLVSVEQKVVQASAQKGVSNAETKTGAKLIHLDMARTASEQEVDDSSGKGDDEE